MSNARSSDVGRAVRVWDRIRFGTGGKVEEALATPMRGVRWTSGKQVSHIAMILHDSAWQTLGKGRALLAHQLLSLMSSHLRRDEQRAKTGGWVVEPFCRMA